MKTSSMMLSFMSGFLIAISSSWKSKTMAASSTTDLLELVPSPVTAAATYIVFTDEPPANVEAEAFSLQTLSAALGSEEAAKKALVHVYKNAATGFAAVLTPDQVKMLEEQPKVQQVILDRKLKLFNPRMRRMDIRT